MIDGPREGEQWRFSLRDGGQGNVGTEFTSTLMLYWELSGDPLTDAYNVSDTPATDLWQMWISQHAEPRMTIYWSIDGSDAAKFEPAPFAPFREGRTFLDLYTWPVAVADGRKLRFTELAVWDRLWRPGRSDKGGFIQELTGWKPSPLQATADISVIAEASGLTAPAR